MIFRLDDSSPVSERCQFWFVSNWCSVLTDQMMATNRTGFPVYNPPPDSRSLAIARSLPNAQDRQYDDCGPTVADVAHETKCCTQPGDWAFDKRAARRPGCAPHAVRKRRCWEPITTVANAPSLHGTPRLHSARENSSPPFPPRTFVQGKWLRPAGQESIRENSQQHAQGLPPRQCPAQPPPLSSVCRDASLLYTVAPKAPPSVLIELRL